MAALLKVFDREMEEAEGLPLTWYDVLLQLDQAPQGGLRMQALAEAILLSRSGLSRLVERMENAGLVCREPCASDRRGFYAVITDEGRRVFRRARRVHQRGIYRHFSQHLDDHDVRALYDAVTKVRKALRGGDGS